MRYVFGILCVCALGLMPLVGCSETEAMPECEVAADCNDDNECTEDACTGGLCENAAVEVGTACSSGACLGGECTALATVSGIVTLVETLDEEEFPAVGATVSVIGTSLSTTTNDSGEFSFDVFAGDWFFQTSKPETWGWIELETIPAEGRNDLNNFGVLADSFMTELENALMIDVDDTKGIVWMTFLPNSGLGGETATLSEPHDDGLTWDENENWTVSEELVPGGSPDLGFFDVDLTEELTVMPKGVEGVNECTLNHPDLVYPIRAKFNTVGVQIECAPDS